MTALAELRSSARKLCVATMLPLVPGSAAAFIALVGGDSSFVGWCADSWWVAAVIGQLCTAVVSATGQWLLKCPSCNYRLVLAGVGITQLAFERLGVLCCPHCGVAWQTLRSRVT